jgi:hypothetical protein
MVTVVTTVLVIIWPPFIRGRSSTGPDKHLGDPREFTQARTYQAGKLDTHNKPKLAEYVKPKGVENVGKEFGGLSGDVAERPADGLSRRTVPWIRAAFGGTSPYTGYALD